MICARYYTVFMICLYYGVLSNFLHGDTVFSARGFSSRPPLPIISRTAVLLSPAAAGPLSVLFFCRLVGAYRTAVRVHIIHTYITRKAVLSLCYVLYQVQTYLAGMGAWWVRGGWLCCCNSWCFYRCNAGPAADVFFPLRRRRTRRTTPHRQQ